MQNKKERLHPPLLWKTGFAGLWASSCKCATSKNVAEADEPGRNSFTECFCDKNIFKGSSINFIKLHCALHTAGVSSTIAFELAIKF